MAERDLKEEMGQSDFNNVDEFISYLENTLIPDLEESGKEATADDFVAMVGFLRGGKMVGDWKSKEQFISFLEGTLIPDLHTSGDDFTAEDFETGIRFLKMKSGISRLNSNKVQAYKPESVEIDQAFPTGDAKEAVKMALEIIMNDKYKGNSKLEIKKFDLKEGNATGDATVYVGKAPQTLGYKADVYELDGEIYVGWVEVDMSLFMPEYGGPALGASVQTGLTIKRTPDWRLVSDDRQLDWDGFTGVVTGMNEDEFQGAFPELEELKYPKDFVIRIKKGKGPNPESKKYSQEKLEKMLDYQTERNEKLCKSLNKIMDKVVKKYGKELEAIGLEYIADLGEPDMDGYGLWDGEELSPENKEKMYAISDKMNEEVWTEFLNVVSQYKTVK